MCKTQEQVTEWLRHKYVMLYYTTQFFNVTSNEVQKMSTLMTIPFNRVVNTHHRFAMKKTNYLDEHLFYNIEQLPDQALVERLPPNELINLDDHRLAISFEVD